MNTSLPMLIVTIPFVAFWSIGCAAVGAGVCALIRRRKPQIVKVRATFMLADTAAVIERSAAVIKSVRERREANDARLAALDEVVADLAASNWPNVGATAEERVESIRRRVDEKLAAKSGGSKDVGPVPIDPGVAGPNVGPVPIDPGVKVPSGEPEALANDLCAPMMGHATDLQSERDRKANRGREGYIEGVKMRTWEDVLQDQVVAMNEISALPRPDGWSTMSLKERVVWSNTEIAKRVDPINAAWWANENHRRESLARRLNALDEIKAEVAGTDWCAGTTVEERCAWLRSRVTEKLAEQDARAK